MGDNTMNETKYCERVRERLFLYLDDGLSDLEFALDQGHMECCAGCAAERDALLELMGGVQRCMSTSSAQLQAELLALTPRLAQARPRPTSLRLLSTRATISLITAAAAVLLLMALGFSTSGWSDLGGSQLVESLGMVDWGMPLGDGLWGAKQ